MAADRGRPGNLHPRYERHPIGMNLKTKDSRARHGPTVKSARRVLEILEYFDRDHPSATVMDMSRALSYPQSSTSELLRSLTRLGYLRYDRFQRTYSPRARVALIGAWVHPTLFRSGALLEAMDQVSSLVGETVLLSTAANYAVQHLHVVKGAAAHPLGQQPGSCDYLIHSPYGRLILSSWPEPQARSALHRLNAEELDPARRVSITAMLNELVEPRARGYVVQPTASDDGAGVVAMLLPPFGGEERLVLSVIARLETIEARGEEFLAILRRQCEKLTLDYHPRAVAQATAIRPEITPLDRAFDSQRMYPVG